MTTGWSISRISVLTSTGFPPGLSVLVICQQPSDPKSDRTLSPVPDRLGDFFIDLGPVQLPRRSAETLRMVSPDADEPSLVADDQVVDQAHVERAPGGH